MRTLTVKELREATHKFPDDAIVVIVDYGKGHVLPVAGLAVQEAAYSPVDIDNMTEKSVIVGIGDY